MFTINSIQQIKIYLNDVASSGHSQFCKYLQDIRSVPMCV